MTATQVFNRFLKDYNYNWLKPIFKEIYLKKINLIGQLRMDKDFGSLKNGLKTEKIPLIDFLLKHYQISLQSLLVDAYWRELEIFNKNNVRGDVFKKVRSDFSKFLKESLEGNYRKVFLPDDVREFSYGYRQGYHLVDFKYKWEK